MDKALLLDAVALWMVALCRHNRGYVDGVAALVSFQLSFLLCLCASCVGGLASEPGMLAYCNYACA
jgi:hypothetical protein